jgi:crotonobetainyl-CoA:carnitine CoA-transferase CaiB-like acyl-CoA transferase
MDNLHHRPIKRFYLSGTIHDDAAVIRLKTEYTNLLKSEMKLSGYVPRIDIDPDFTISFDEKTEYFKFTLSIYGTFTGKKKSEWIEALDGTRVIYTPQSKYSESLQEQASPYRER